MTIGRKFKAIRNYVYTTDAGKKLVQRDTIIGEVTFSNKHRFEYKVLERVASENTAPFDTGGMDGGGYSYSGLDYFIQREEFQWLDKQPLPVARKLDPKKSKALFEKNFNDIAKYVYGLKDRWAYEKEYEDFAVYKKAVRSYFALHGIEVESVSKTFRIKCDDGFEVSFHTDGRVSYTA